MKTIDLDTESLSISELLSIAKEELILVLLSSGQEFILKLGSDDEAEFAAEVAILRESKSFQSFLDERLSYKKTTPIEDVLAKVETELSTTQQ